MSKLVSVSQLKVGDVFEFVVARPDDPRGGAAPEKSSHCLVIRAPSVNLAANTCFFRYRRDDAAPGAPAHGESTHSFNGPPDLKVQLPGSEPEPASASAAAKPPTAHSGTDDSARAAKKPAAEKLSPQEAAAPPTTPAKPYMLSKSTKRAVDFSTAERAEPRQEGAILPALSKAKPEAAEKKKATKTAVEKPAAKKKTAEKAAPKKAAATKPAKKAATKKAAAAKPAKKK
jgi:hypothetical protein